MQSSIQRRPVHPVEAVQVPRVPLTESFGISVIAKSLLPQCLVLEAPTCQEPYLRPFKRTLHASALFDKLENDRITFVFDHPSDRDA